MSLGGNGGILAAYVGAVPEPYRRPSIEEEIRRIRAKAAKRGAGVYGTTRAQRARRDREDDPRDGWRSADAALRGWSPW